MERSLSTEVLLALLKDLSHRRPDLKLLISSSSSAYLDALSTYFNGAPIFSIPTPLFPVNIFYTKEAEEDLTDAATTTTLQIHFTSPPGDILIFLPGLSEVNWCAASLGERMKALGRNLPPLIVTRLGKDKVLEPTPQGARQVFVSSPTAASFLPLTGVIYVVDSGYDKLKSFDPRTRVESFLASPISHLQGLRQPTRWACWSHLPRLSLPSLQQGPFRGNDGLEDARDSSHQPLHSLPPPQGAWCPPPASLQLLRCPAPR